MKTFLLTDGHGRIEFDPSNMSFAQQKQAAAIMDCFGRLIPQEGVDYDVEIVFKGMYNPSVSVNIVPHTDKGEAWRGYLGTFMKKYPPTVSNPEPSIAEDPDGSSAGDDDEKNMP